jgi:putative methyltransferase (TIGR04325 family)
MIRRTREFRKSMPSLKSFIPPILLDAYRQTRRPHRRFFGPYEKFEDIEFESPWSTEAWVEEVRGQLARAASAQFSPDPIPTCLTAMMVDLLSSAEPCKVLDFAGGAGVAYFTIRPHLTHPENVSWHVDDNPRLAELGRSQATPADRIEFLDKLPTPGTAYDLVHVNTALQYLSDWKDLVGRLTEYGASQMLLTEIHITELPTFITAQEVVGAKVPCTFINRQELIGFLASHGYDLAFRCPVGYGAYTDWFDDSVPERYREPHSWHIGFARRKSS